MTQRRRSLPSTDKTRRLHGQYASHVFVWRKKAAPTEKGQYAIAQELPTVEEVQWCRKILNAVEFTRLFTGWRAQDKVDAVVAKAFA